MPRRSKFRNQITEVDGIKFHSKKESLRYRELKCLEKAKEIRNLRLQVPFKVEVEGKLICRYVADFVYEEGGREVVEDVKGMRTSLYRLKKKLVEAIYGFSILET